MITKIELSKTRDFGEIITDTFIFIRENLKPLVTCFLIFCGFFIAASIFAAILQQSKMLHQVNNNEFPVAGNNIFGAFTRFRFFGVEYLAGVLIMILNYITMHVTVYSYICLYKEKGNIPPTPQEVWGYIKYFYLKILGSGIVIFFLLVIALLLCIIPGIYLYPILALIYPIMIFENTTFSYAFNRSFKLIKDNWWPTFGAIVVIIIIVYFATLIILLPTTVLTISNLLLHPGKGLHLSTTITIIATILQHICQIFYIIPLVTVSLCYFNLSEKSENTGLMSRISQLGNTNTDNNLPAEEY